MKQIRCERWKFSQRVKGMGFVLNVFVRVREERRESERRIRLVLESEGEGEEVKNVDRQEFG